MSVDLNTNNEINALTQALTLVIIRYLNYQNKLLDHILSKNLIHIDPELIPLNDLKDILRDVEKQIDNVTVESNRKGKSSGM